MVDLDKSKIADKLDVFNPYDYTYLGTVPMLEWAEIDNYLSLIHI